VGWSTGGALRDDGRSARANWAAACRARARIGDDAGRDDSVTHEAIEVDPLTARHHVHHRHRSVIKDG
jgi:hypothetical protein